MRSRSANQKKKITVSDHLSRMARKGKVTVLRESRHKPKHSDGDTVAWGLRKQQVGLQRRDSIVDRTAGSLRGGGNALTAEEERAAVEQAIAEEVVHGNYS